jgi:pimeloyl-ACP methyl ester carboxylesterase
VQLGGFVAPLLARDYRVVWFDQPGHGESDSGRVALPDMVRALDALAATHGPFAAAIGHSLGAAALGLALRRGFALARVVFVSPPASMNEHARNFARLLGFTPPVREAMRRRLEGRYGMRFSDIDRTEELEQVGVPALFVHDAGDREVPFVHALKLSARMPRARLVKTWGLGHHRILRDGEVIRAAVDFVSGDDAAIPAELPAIPVPAPLY